MQFVACEKEPENKPNPKPEKEKSAELSVIWDQWVYDDSTGTYMYPPQFAGDYVAVFVHQPYTTNKLGMVIYDRITGEPHPAWDHEPNFSGNATSDWEIGGENKDVVVILSGRTLYAYDINTAQELWTKYSGTDEYYNFRLNSFGNYLYVSKCPATIEAACKIGLFECLSMV